MPKIKSRGSLGIPGLAKLQLEVEGDSCEEVVKEVKQCIELMKKAMEHGVEGLKRRYTRNRHKS